IEPEPEPGPWHALLARLNADTPDAVSLVEHVELPGHTVSRFRLKNGLDVILVEDPFTPVVAYQTWYRAGSRHEPRDKQGLAHILEHLMFRRTKNLEDGRFDKEMEQYGID